MHRCLIRYCDAIHILKVKQNGPVWLGVKVICLVGTTIISAESHYLCMDVNVPLCFLLGRSYRHRCRRVKDRRHEALTGGWGSVGRQWRGRGCGEDRSPKPTKGDTSPLTLHTFAQVRLILQKYAMLNFGCCLIFAFSSKDTNSKDRNWSPKLH